MQYLRIVDWSNRFENNRSRGLKNLEWISVPNSHDGDGFTELMDHENGPAHFAAWILILQVASKNTHIPHDSAGFWQEGARLCDVRGALLRSSEKPHDAKSLSRMTRCPEKVFAEAIPRLIALGWIEIITVKSTFSENPAGGCQMDVRTVPGSDYGMEGNGMEGNGNNTLSSSQTNCDDAHDETPLLNRIMKTDIEEPEKPKANGYGPDARAVLHILNEIAGRSFRETDANLKLIKMRLKEPGVEVDGIRKMIKRQLDMWRGTEFERFMRPETLFNATKFSGYYDDREQPVKRGREAIRAQTEDVDWVAEGRRW